MKLLILDTETSGVDPQTDRVVEVGLAIWDTRHKTMVSAFSSLVASPYNEAQPLNGIPATMLQELEATSQWEYRPQTISAALEAYAEGCDVILAHNAAFDRSFVERDAPLGPPWVCTWKHVEWPLASGSKSLTSLCLAAGLGVASAHRALTDVLLLVRLLERVSEMGHDVEALIRDGLKPRVEVKAMVSYEKRALAKEAGFSWDGDVKLWKKEVKEESLTLSKDHDESLGFFELPNVPFLVRKV